MENTTLKQENIIMRELPIVGIMAFPIIYLLTIWNNLPEQVPTHWNFQGEIDAYGHKSYLWIIILAINIPIYLLLLFLPKMGGKEKNMELMGNKYHRLRLILQLFLSALVTVIIAETAGHTSLSITFMLGVCFALFMILFGNYMGNIRQNHFVGIRTPWTLQNEEVWKKTHELGGKLWMAGGAMGLALLLILPNNWALMTIVILMILPMIYTLFYSYSLFRKLENVKPPQ